MTLIRWLQLNTHLTLFSLFAPPPPPPSQQSVRIVLLDKKTGKLIQMPFPSKNDLRHRTGAVKSKTASEKGGSANDMFVKVIMVSANGDFDMRQAQVDARLKPKLPCSISLWWTRPDSTIFDWYLVCVTNHRYRLSSFTLFPEHGQASW